jgi:sugar phosphate isomerase/epimerase
LLVEKWPIGVFSSIDAGLGVQLDVARELGVTTIHLHAPTQANRTPERATEFRAKLDDLGIRTTVVFGGFEGESYANIPTVTRTVGLVPPATREARTREMMEISDFARTLGVDVVALHLGFVSHDTSDPLFAEVVDVTRRVLDHCKGNDQALHLETGQESADALLAFIDATERDNLFVNFDPANMILYGSGEPIDALKKIGSLVHSVHCKDGTWAERPREEWGAETPLGEGDVNMELYLRTLNEIGYTGPLTIEREIPNDPARQKAEISHAVNLLNKLKAEILC